MRCRSTDGGSQASDENVCCVFSERSMEMIDGDDLDSLRSQARELVARQGLREVAEALGLSQDTLARFVAGARSHNGTVKLVEVGLKGKRR